MSLKFLKVTLGACSKFEDDFMHKLKVFKGLMVTLGMSSKFDGGF